MYRILEGHFCLIRLSRRGFIACDYVREPFQKGVRTDSIAHLRSLGFGAGEGHANGISGPMWGA
jgi:hypothetical protein